MNKPLIGISACLLGRRVRHNGEHKRNDWIVDQLGNWVQWIPFCPEVEMGLGVPRSTLHLERLESTKPFKLVSHRSTDDLSLRAYHAAETIFKRDFQEGNVRLDGIIFKKDSPSCGLERVKVYAKNNIPVKSGIGVFASYIRDKFIFIPMIEEGRLSDPRQREEFATQVFTTHRLHQVTAEIAEIQDFHRRAKLLIMSHSLVHYSMLEKLVGNHEKLPSSEILLHYQKLFFEALSVSSTIKKRVNVLQHILGYFKKRLDLKDRHLILKAIEQYHVGHLPFAAPVTVLRHFIEKFEVTYLEDQLFFFPYPQELGLIRGI
jgi:uncharacterized protein YbgA (DUF1722 family)/uncharacterized protein YbbK (DUF523 family)